MESHALHCGYISVCFYLGAFVGFMCRVAKVDELASIGSRLLTGFRHALGEVCFFLLFFIPLWYIDLLMCRLFYTWIEWIRRPPFHEKSKVVANIISAHQTERLTSYVEAGCRHAHTASQKIAQCKYWIFVNLVFRCNYFMLESLLRTWCSLWSIYFLVVR